VPLQEGTEHGGAPVSFFMNHAPPGRGPTLHMHRYALTEHVTRQALAWSRYFDATDVLREVDEFMERYRPAMIAHGNVISQSGPG
jgi:hypothetical protein